MIDHEVILSIGLISSISYKSENISVFEIWVFEDEVWSLS